MTCQLLNYCFAGSGHQDPSGKMCYETAEGNFADSRTAKDDILRSIRGKDSMAIKRSGLYNVVQWPAILSFCRQTRRHGIRPVPPLAAAPHSLFRDPPDRIFPARWRRQLTRRSTICSIILNKVPNTSRQRS